MGREVITRVIGKTIFFTDLASISVRVVIASRASSSEASWRAKESIGGWTGACTRGNGQMESDMATAFSQIKTVCLPEVCGIMENL